MVGRKELGTPKNLAVLEDIPTSTDKHMVDLLRYPSSIAIPSPLISQDETVWLHLRGFLDLT